MSEIIDTTAIYRGGRKARFSCYEIDENGKTVLLPTGQPKKLYFQLQNSELRTNDAVKIRSIDAWIKYHTYDVVKTVDGVKKTVGQTCDVKIEKFSEAELLKLQEPEFIVVKNDKGEEVKVGINEMKAAYIANQAKTEQSKDQKPIHGTRSSQNTDAKGGK